MVYSNYRGRFSLRNFGLAQTLITDDPAKLGKYLDDKRIDVMAIDPLDSGSVVISYIKKKDWIEEHDSSNCGNYKEMGKKILHSL